MLNKKWYLWGLILISISLPAPLIIQHLQSYVVRNAVVTAYLYHFYAPIDGVVEGFDSLPGDGLQKTPVLTLHNKRLPYGYIEELQVQHSEKQKHRTFLIKELSLLESRLEESKELFEDYQNLLQKDSDQIFAILEARQAANSARLKEASQNRQRNITLAQSALVSQVEMDRVEVNFREAEARFNVAKVELQQIKDRKSMLPQDLFLSNFSDGVLQERSRISILQMKILDCKRLIHEIDAELVGFATQLKTSLRDFPKLTNASITLSDNDILWDADVKSGTEVNKGDHLFSYIDRNLLMVDVAIDDATIALIKPGHPVQVRLFGSSRRIDGKVIQVRGSASNSIEDGLAAKVKNTSTRDGHVLVQIEDQQLYDDAKSFCGIGRTAYAEFEGIGLMEQYFGAFLR